MLASVDRESGGRVADRPRSPTMQAAKVNPRPAVLKNSTKNIPRAADAKTVHETKSHDKGDPVSIEQVPDSVCLCLPKGTSRQKRFPRLTTQLNEDLFADECSKHGRSNHIG